jgi:5-methylcytosine-specific restriction protein A
MRLIGWQLETFNLSMTKLFWLQADKLKKFRRQVYQSKQWKATRQWVLNETPFCAVCDSPANEIDHIIPLSKIYMQQLDGNLAYDTSNLQALCKSCHSKKSWTEGIGIGKAKKEAAPKGVVIVDGKIKNQ